MFNRFRRTKQLESDIINSFDMLLVLKPRDEGLASVYSKPIAYKVKLVILLNNPLIKLIVKLTNILLLLRYRRHLKPRTKALMENNFLFMF